MTLADIKEWADFLWPFISPIAALLCTFTLVSFFKSILKHYKRGIWDKFTMVLIIRLAAFITGYAMAFVFLRHLDSAGQWALGLAILNIPIYSAMLNYAASKQWLAAVAILKGRKVIVRQGEHGEMVEKVMDDNDKTMMARRVTDKR